MLQRCDVISGGAFFAVAALLRCAFVASVARHPAVMFPMVDSRSYHAKALKILGGDWLGDAIYYQDPLSPYFFAALYAVFGAGSAGVLLAQAVLDAGTVLLVFAIARRVFDYRTAVIAGVFATFYKLFFYYDALLLKVSLTVFLITLTLYAVIAAASQDRARQWFAVGGALGLAALTRGNYLLFAPALLAWVPLAMNGPPAAHVRRLLWVTAGLCVAILPVTLRNFAVADDFVLITSQAGQNFYIGSHRGNDTGRYKAPPFVRANPFYEESDFREEADRRTGGRPMKPSDLSRFWFQEGVAEIRADPGHFLRHSLSKARLFFNAYEVPATNSFYFFREYVAPVLRLPAPTYGALLPLALCGMYFARRNRSAQLLTLFFFTYAFTVIVTFNMSRYRMPVVPVVIVFAAAAAAHLVDLAAARRLREAAAVLVFLAIAYPLVHQEVTRDNFASNHLNLGSQHAGQAAQMEHRARRHERAGDTPAAERARDLAAEHSALAEAQFQMGVEIQPGHPVLRRELGALLLSKVREQRRAGEFERALGLARDLTATLPAFADGHVALGSAYSDLGRYGEARRALQRALVLSPGHPEAIAELALTSELEPADDFP